MVVVSGGDCLEPIENNQAKQVYEETSNQVCELTTEGQGAEG